MGATPRAPAAALWMVAFLSVAAASLASTVSYDHRALVIDGKRRVLISGSVHYPRSTPQMWPDIIQKAKAGGLDAIDTYVFWNLHEPVRGQYDFSGRKDLVSFIKLVEEAGLYLLLRIGPYACAEWNYGGFPIWLHSIPGIVFRTDNEPFKIEMQRFTSDIVDLMKSHSLFASQGGPIILSQIENEYGDKHIEYFYGASGKSYVTWAAKMATALDTGVPWIMCKQPDAPDPIIDTCNNFYCDQFTPNSNNKPKMWTENWIGWFLTHGGTRRFRPVEDIAFAVARFFQLGGTFQNYYMYHGGTNFGRTSGGPLIATSYDYDAPIDEFGIIREPKWSHLKELHKAIKLCEESMLETDPISSSISPHLEVSLYKTDSGLCSAYLANIDKKSDATVNFNGRSHHLPAWSVSILPDCKNVAFNSAKINSMTTQTSFIRQSSEHSFSDESDDRWSYVIEPAGITSDDAFTKLGLIEQISITADRSDYLWYSSSIEIKGDEPFLRPGSKTTLYIESFGHALHAFVNKKLAGWHTLRYQDKSQGRDNKLILDTPISLNPGNNTIDLLSLTVGLKNYEPFFESRRAGVTGPVQIKDFENVSTVDLSSEPWTYQVGFKGESIGLSSGGSLLWVSGSALPKKQPLIWYKSLVDAPGGNDPVALDLSAMGKGEAWINGESIGRYWSTYIAPNSGCSACDYRGKYYAKKCKTNCGKPSQLLYHVPREWLKPARNVLVLFEEIGGDPTQISFATRQKGNLCSHISESHPVPVDMWRSANDHDTEVKAGSPTMLLECHSPNQAISAVKFASFGTPEGTCGSFRHGQCSSKEALAIVEKACIGLRKCSIPVSAETLGNPCAGVTMSLAVEASCA